MNISPSSRSARIALCLAALGGSASALAAPPEGGPPDGLDRRIERMSQELKLTPEQQTQIRAIVEQERAAVDRQRQEARQRIDAVLTDTQRAERDRMLDRRLDNRVDRLASRLSLDSAQTEKVRSILMERRTNPNLGPKEMKDRIAAVLSEDQRKKLDAMVDRRGSKGCEPERGPRPGPRS